MERHLRITVFVILLSLTAVHAESGIEPVEKEVSQKEITELPECVVLPPFCHGGGASKKIESYHSGQGYVGNPNNLPRNDRAMFSFDIRRFLWSGKITRSVLEMDVTPMGGDPKCNLFELEMFTSPRPVLREMDLIASDTISVYRFPFDRDSGNRIELDTSELLNAALAKGDGFLSFRLRNLTTEKHGNRYGRAEGLIADYTKINLKVIP